MPRRASAEAVLPAPWTHSPIVRGFKVAFQIAFTVFLVIATVICYFRVEQFLISDSRFVLVGPPEPGVPSENFQVIGTHYASPEQVAAVFARDFGRSIYLCPIAERRRRLLHIDWVKTATVLRVWPNRITVRIAERTPVAFVQVPGADHHMTFGLVDAEGVMLDPQRAVKLGLPVLAGFPPKEAEEKRKERVKRFLRLQKELGPLMEKISEVDIADIDNLKVVQIFEGRALTLMVGNQKFEERMQNFLENFGEIRKRLPDATVLDLRLKDRITAVGASSPAI